MSKKYVPIPEIRSLSIGSKIEIYGHPEFNDPDLEISLNASTGERTYSRPISEKPETHEEYEQNVIELQQLKVKIAKDLIRAVRKFDSSVIAIMRKYDLELRTLNY